MCKCINPEYRAYRVKVQFFTPDSIPTAKGSFTTPAIDEGEAVEIVLTKLIEAGYGVKELSLISVSESA